MAGSSCWDGLVKVRKKYARRAPNFQDLRERVQTMFGGKWCQEDGLATAAPRAFLRDLRDREISIQRDEPFNEFSLQRQLICIEDSYCLLPVQCDGGSAKNPDSENLEIAAERS